MIPQEVITNSSVVTIIGNNCITFENYKGILEYDSNKLIVQTKKNKITILGEKLCIQYFYDYEMRVSGKICEISIQKV